MSRIFRTLSIAAAAAFVLSAAGQSSAQTLSASLRDFSLSGDGCPSMDAVKINVTEPSRTAPGMISVDFADDSFSVSGADAQRACTVLVNLALTGPRQAVSIARGNVGVLGANTESGRSTVTFRARVGRRSSRPATLVVGPDADLAMPTSLAFSAGNVSGDFLGTASLMFELTLQTSGASADTTVTLDDLDVLFSAAPDAAG